MDTVNESWPVPQKFLSPKDPPEVFPLRFIDNESPPQFLLSPLNSNIDNTNKVSFKDNDKIISPKKRMRYNVSPSCCTTDNKKSPANSPYLLPLKDPTIGCDLISNSEKLLLLPRKDPSIVFPPRFSPLVMLPSRPALILPPRDPTIGLDLIEKSDEPKKVYKHPLPQKIDIDKINENYRKENMKIMQAKSIQQVSCPRGVDKGRRMALFKPSRTSVVTSFKRKSTTKRTSIIINKKSITAKKLKALNESLKDVSLVEKKIFCQKSRDTFNIKSPAVQKSISKPEFKLPVALQKEKEIPKNTNQKSVSNLTKTPSKKPMNNSDTNYIEEIKKLNEKLDTCKKDYVALQKEFNEFKKVYDDRLNKIENLLQKTVTEKKENVTPNKSEQIESSRTPTLRKTVELSTPVTKALNMYNSFRKNFQLSTPKFNRLGVTGTPTPKNSKRTISRKIQQQCLMLQLDTPKRK